MSNGDVSTTPPEINGAGGKQSPENEPPSRKSSSGVVLNAEIQKQIGNRLKNLYEEVINQDVPERFLKLLQQLDSKSTLLKSDD